MGVNMSELSPEDLAFLKKTGQVSEQPKPVTKKVEEE
jgi:hypothetical protein